MPADKDPQEPRHHLYQTIQLIQELPVPGDVKGVLISLARHGDWTARAGCRPANATIARDASVNVARVRWLLRRLACRADEAARGFCIGGRHCQHWGLIQLERPAEPARPASWRLDLQPTMFQLQMPEVGVAEAALLPRRDSAPRSCDFPGCAEPHHARGLCATHYKRRQRHGSPAIVARQPIFGTEGPSVRTVDNRRTTRRQPVDPGQRADSA